jgi:ribosome-associated protein
MTEAPDDATTPLGSAGEEGTIAGLPDPLSGAAQFALERKARDVLAMDLREISSATDFFLLATGNSDIQVRAIADHILDQLRLQGHRPNHVEGLQGGRWVLLDFVDYVIHVFHPAARDFYQLERLWGDAMIQRFGDDDAPPETEKVGESEDG